MSLPKVLGSYSGGLLLCKSKEEYDKYKKLQAMDLKLGQEQSYLKYLSCYNPAAITASNNWHYREYGNFSMDINSLDNIINCLDNYELNIKTAKRRLKILKMKELPFPMYKERLATQAVLNCNEYEVSNDRVISRMMNTSLINDGHEIYEKHYLIPLHFGVDENIFDDMILSVKNKI